MTSASLVSSRYPHHRHRHHLEARQSTEICVASPWIISGITSFVSMLVFAVTIPDQPFGRIASPIREQRRVVTNPGRLPFRLPRSVSAPLLSTSVMMVSVRTNSMPQHGGRSLEFKLLVPLS